MLKIRPVIISVILAMLAYGIWIAYNEHDKVFAAMTMVGIKGSLIIVFLSLLNYAARYIRWHWFCRLMGYEIPWRKNLLYYLAGFALTTTPGKAGEVIRSVYMKPHGVTMGSSIAAVVAERISDLLSVTILAIVAIYHFPSYAWLAVLTSTCVLFGIFFIHNRKLQDKTRCLVQNLTDTHIRKVFLHFLNLIKDISLLLGRKAFLKGLCIGTIGWAAEAYGLFYIISAMGYAAPLLIVFGIYSLSMLAGAVSFMPGGLGGAEAVMSLLLIALNINTSDAVTATILCRLVTLWLAVMIGLVALSYAESKRSKSAAFTTL